MSDSATSRTPLEGDATRAYPRVMDATETCPNCDGEGIVADHHAPVLVDQPIPSTKPCPVCGGKGVVEVVNPT